MIEGDKVLPGWTRTKTFTVENLGDVAVNYDIDIIDVASTFEGQDLVYEITSTNNGGTKTETVLPNTNDTLIINATIEPLTTQTYTIKITFKETGSDQNIDQGKSYRGKLQITPRTSSVSVAGYALDGEGNPLPNRVVELHSDPVSTTTDSSGYYEFRNVQVGEHTIILKNSTNTAEEASKTINLASGSETRYTNNILILENTIKKYINLELNGNTINLVVEPVKLVYQKSYGGTSADRFSVVTATSDGGYVAVGDTSSTIEGLTSYGAYDAIIVKYDSNGNIEWQKNYGGTSSDIFYGVTTTSDGGYVVVGHTSSTIEGLTSYGSVDAIIVKYDEDGNVEWQKSYGGTAMDSFSGVTTTPDGGVIAVGTTNGNIEGLTSYGSGGAIIVKYDSNGNVVWQKRYGGTAMDYFNGVTTTPDGGAIAVGSTNGNIEGLTSYGG